MIIYETKQLTYDTETGKAYYTEKEIKGNETVIDFKFEITPIMVTVIDGKFPAYYCKETMIGGVRNEFIYFSRSKKVLSYDMEDVRMMYSDKHKYSPKNKLFLKIENI